MEHFKKGFMTTMGVFTGLALYVSVCKLVGKSYEKDKEAGKLNN